MAGLFLRWSWWFFKSNQDHKRRFLFRKSGLKKAFKTTLATALLMEYGLGCKRDSVGASLSEAQPFLGSLTNEKLPYLARCRLHHACLDSLSLLADGGRVESLFA